MQKNIFWRIYFYVLVTLSVFYLFSYVMGGLIDTIKLVLGTSVLSLEPSMIAVDIMMTLVWSSVLGASLLGMHGFVFNKARLRGTLLWKGLFILLALSFVFTLMQMARSNSLVSLLLPLVVVVAPAIYALYKYAFKSNHLWN